MAIHCGPDSALRCSGGHTKPRRTASAEGHRFSPALAGAEAAFPRSHGRGFLCLGADLAEFRNTRVDSGRGALADRTGGLRGRAIWFLFRNAICSRTQSALTHV